MMTGTPDEVPQADASVARRPGTVCAILVADCLPDVVHRPRRQLCIAAAHAGWRGLAGGVTRQHHRAHAGTTRGPDGLDRPRHRSRRPSKSAMTCSQAFCADAFRNGKSAFKPLACRRQMALRPAGTGARCTAKAPALTRIYGGDFCTYSGYASAFIPIAAIAVTGRMAALLWISDNGVATADTV